MSITMMLHRDHPGPTMVILALMVAIILDHHRDDRHRSSRSSSTIITMIATDRRDHLRPSSR
jgi:hypothetical protein